MNELTISITVDESGATVVTCKDLDDLSVRGEWLGDALDSFQFSLEYYLSQKYKDSPLDAPAFLRQLFGGDRHWVNWVNEAVSAVE